MMILPVGKVVEAFSVVVLSVSATLSCWDWDYNMAGGSQLSHGQELQGSLGVGAPDLLYCMS